MKPQAMLDELEGAAAKLEVKVTYESLSATVGHGGLCRVKGEYRIIIDKRASVQERAVTLAESLSALDTSNVFLSPRVRDMVEYYGAVASRATSPASSARP